jgi:hypothetical protein
MKYHQPTNKLRQNLISQDYSSWSMKENPIDTLQKLREQLKTAIKIELATIPPYLCALWSIKEGTNGVATGIIRSVVMEEMLHLCLASNILNAIGGKPEIDEKTMLEYPDHLPQNAGKFKVGLIKFSPEAIKTFLEIEKPAKGDKPPVVTPSGIEFQSIGQFYTAVKWALEQQGEKIFKAESNQLTAENYYGSGGKLIAVHNLTTAKQAIDEIIGQGEGIDRTIVDGIPGNFKDQVELAHYFRFKEIAKGRRYKKDDTTQGDPTGEPIDVDWGAVHNMTPNPKIEKDYHDYPEIAEKAREFNRTYAQLLKNINDACTESPESLKVAIPQMYDLKYQAIGLMKTPLGQTGLYAGPTFEPVNA